MVTLKFHCYSDDGTNIQLYANEKTNRLYLEVSDEYSEVLGNMELDKSTAIKLSKELRKQIALLQ